MLQRTYKNVAFHCPVEPHRAAAVKLDVQACCREDKGSVPEDSLFLLQPRSYE